jgi:hypothetical protein
MRFLLAILLLLPWPGWALRAQDLTGQWTGSATSNLSDKKHKLVLTIASGDSAFGGVLHWYLPEVNTIRHLVISGRYYGKDSILSIREDSIQDDGILHSDGEEDGASETEGLIDVSKRTGVGRSGGTNRLTPIGRGFSILYYKRIGHKEVLEGHWRDPAGSMAIRLEKKAPPFIPILITHKKKDSAQTRQYEELLGRKSFIAASIPVRGGIDSIKVQLYDNGEIDGDSVSLYLNGELVAGHLKLAATAKTLVLPLDKSLPVNKLLLFAENLGRLPPNTALMEVTVNGKVYNLFLSTDYKRNATVEFELQE